MGDIESGRTVVVLITSPPDEADEIASVIVEGKLAACVNIVPSVRSVFWWEGKVEHEDESLLVVKTTREVVAPLIDRVRDVHPYENFELIALPIDAGSQPYLRWIVKTLT